jgi:hypothetical protein
MYGLILFKESDPYNPLSSVPIEQRENPPISRPYKCTRWYQQPYFGGRNIRRITYTSRLSDQKDKQFQRVSEIVDIIIKVTHLDECDIFTNLPLPAYCF